jgi:hypothetical protein
MKKIALINSLILLKIIFQKNINLNSNKIYCKEKEEKEEKEISNIKFLLKFNKEKFNNKLCPKLIYFSNANNNNNNNKEKENLKSNFEKIHEKYPDIESYYIDIFKDLDNFSELNDLIKEYGTSLDKIFPEPALNNKNILKGNEAKNIELNNVANREANNFNFNLNLVEVEVDNLEKYFNLKEAIKNKPYLFFNKYGDIKAYSYEEFYEIANGEGIYNFFEKFSILNNKTDILFMNDYDNIFLIFLDGKKVDYMHPNFKIFRKIFFNLNFFNIKFFVCTKENKALFNLNNNNDNNNYSENDINNNIFLLKRNNLFSNEKEKSNDLKTIEIDGENFNMLNLTKDLIEINKENNYKGEEGSKNKIKIKIEIEKINKYYIILYSIYSFIPLIFLLIFKKFSR